MYIVLDLAYTELGKVNAKWKPLTKLYNSFENKFLFMKIKSTERKYKMKMSRVCLCVVQL